MAEQIGEITILHGKAVAEGPDGVRELAIGSPIFNDDVISTESKSAIEIEFSDGALLSQGANSKVHLDDYVFDPDIDAGEITMNLIEGTFRSVTGQIVDMNPEGFHIETPNTTIGIRGTTTGHMIGAGGKETHAVIDFVDKPVVFTSVATGRSQVISRDGFKVVATATGIGPVSKASVKDLATFKQLSSSSLQKSAPEPKDGGDDKPDDGDDPNKETGGVEEPQGEQPQGDFDHGQAQPMQLVALPMGEMPGIIPPPLPPTGPLMPPGILPPPPPTGVLPPPPPFTPPPPEDIPDEVLATTLNLSAFQAPLTAVLANSPAGEYYPTGTPANTTPISSNIVNLIGALNYANDITGNAQNNVLTGGIEADDLKGEAGNDTLVGLAGPDVLNGGADFDYADYTLSIAGISATMGTSSVSDGYGDNDNILNIEGIIGSAYNDVFTDNSADPYSHFIGNDGNDQFIVYNGAVDTIEGGAGDDKISMYQTPLSGSEIHGGSGQDTLAVSGGSDVDFTNTTITGIEEIQSHQAHKATFSADQVVSDWIINVNANGGTEIVEIDMPNAGTLDVSGFTFGGNWDLATDQIHLVGSAGDDNITGSSGIDSITGGNGNDTIFGISETDTLDGGAGDDKLIYTDATPAGGSELNNVTNVEYIEFGNATTNVTTVDSLVAAGSTLNVDASDLTGGNTLWWDATAELDATADLVITGGAGGDSLFGGSGDDYFSGSSGADSMTGSAGSDTLNGDSGNDTLSGDAGDDRVDGCSGNDLITGGNGNDTLIGGTGDDTLSYDLDANNLVIDLNNSTVTVGGDTDTISGFESIKSGNGNDLLTGTSDANDIRGSSGTDTIYGGGGDDSLQGGIDNDTLYGEADNDTLEGGIGDDIVDGGTGADYLEGNVGNDSLFGGAGADTITGGADNDTFCYTAIGDAGDTIKDFTGVDRLELDDAGFTSLSTGVLPGTSFYVINNATDHAAYETNGTLAGMDADDYIVYAEYGTTWELYYDDDGDGSNQGTKLCTFDPIAADPTLDAGDITVV